MTEPLDDGSRLRLATWNVMSGRTFRGSDEADARAHGGTVQPGRLAEQAAGLNVDVLALQEVDRGQDRSGTVDQTAEIARACGAAWHHFAPTLQGTPGSSKDWEPVIGDGDVPDPSYGVALVSRWPVRSWHVVRFPAGHGAVPVLVPQGDRLGTVLVADEPRAAIVAVIEHPAGPVTVAAAHLSFLPWTGGRQLRRLVRHLAVTATDGPVLVAGDLNMPAGRAARLSGWRSLAKARTFPSPAPKVQLDHVLLGPSGDVAPWALDVTTPHRAVSDHRPLVVDLALS